MIYKELSEPWFTYIIDGKKTVEGRLNKEKSVLEFTIGNDIVFINGGREIHVHVIDVNIYSSFEEMLTKEGITNILPNVDSIEEGVKIYRSISDEYREKEFEYGILAAHLTTH